MVRQNKSKKPGSVGKGKVTPVQVAFIVDRYLSDNSYTETRSCFRSEASNLLSKSPVQEAPKSLLTLSAMLEEYITLKEQKLWVDQERCRLEQEKLRVHNLLKGMQNVMNVYNSCGNPAFTPLASLAVASGAMVSQADNSTIVTQAGNFPINNTPAMMSATRPLTIKKDSTDFHTPVPTHVATKRKGAKNVLDCPINSKKSRSCAQHKGTKPSNKETNQEKSVIAFTSQPPIPDDNPKRSPVQGSNVVKCLFSPKNTFSATNTSVPKTPPRASSSETEKSISPVETCSTTNSNKDTTTPQQIMSTNCTIISSETIRVSPNKQIAYYSIEKNRYISTCSPVKTNLKRSNVKDHVKGRLDFGASDVPMITENQTPDGPSTSESEKEGDYLDLDLDALGIDFNLSEFLKDFDFEGEGLCLSSQQRLDSSPDSHTCSPSTSGNVDMDLRESRQMMSQFSSTMAEFIGDKNMNLVGHDSVATMQSITQCIILSPVKSQRNSLDQENLSSRN